jgi:group I intron endonuclease
MLGIYSIVNKITNDLYIGSSVDVARRFRQHKRDLHNNKCSSRILQSAWNKYGEDAFTWNLLEEVDAPEFLAFVENHWIEKLEPKYNCMQTSHRIGTEEGVRYMKEKQSQSKSKYIPNNNQQAALLMGRGPKSEETKQKISAALHGHAHSEETRRKIGEASNLYERDEAYRQKMSEVKRGHPTSEETKDKIRQKQLAHWERKREELRRS